VRLNTAKVLKSTVEGKTSVRPYVCCFDSVYVCLSVCLYV